MSFKGAIAVITGAAQGIGRATALALGARGAMVIVTDIDAAGARAVADEILTAGGRAEYHRCDVASDGDVKSLRDAVLAAHGAPDLLINNAYARALSRTSLDAPDLEAWRRAFDINVLGNIRMITAFLPAMEAVARQGPALDGGLAGHIVDTSSSLAIAPNPDAAEILPYISTKGAILGMGYGLVSQLRARGLNYSIFCPGKTATGPRAEELGDLPGPDHAAEILLAGIERGDFLISTEPGFPEVIVCFAAKGMDPHADFR